MMMKMVLMLNTILITIRPVGDWGDQKAVLSRAQDHRHHTASGVWVCGWVCGGGPRFHLGRLSFQIALFNSTCTVSIHDLLVRNHKILKDQTFHLVAAC